jgi:RNA polymerase sigma factor (sigma-70 family)
MNDLPEEVSDIVAQVARIVHRKYHPYFDVADVRQELLLWCVRRQDKIAQWISPNQKPEDLKAGLKHLGKTLTRQADKYCRRAKAQKLGYEIRDEQYYSVATLEDMLPLIWSEVLETRAPNSDEVVTGGGTPSEGGNYVIQLFDVRRAVHKLDPMDQLVLQMKYYDNQNYTEMAELLQCSDTTAHRRVTGALRRLHYSLGGDNPFGKGEE